MKKNSILIMLLLFMNCLVFSQLRTGNIYGTVLMEDGSAVPGVLVTLTSAKSGKLTSFTSVEGKYRFLSLPPAKDYTIKVELKGFSTQIKRNIRAVVGENIKVNFIIKIGKIKETIEVKGTNPTIDILKTTAATNVTQEILQSLPTARDPWAILSLAPGMMMDRQNVGGNESGQQSSYSSRGGDRSNSQWNVDGVEVTDPTAPGTSGMYYDFDMLEEIQIQTAANDVSAMTGGVNINFVTRRGSNKFSGGARFYLTDDSFQGDNVPSTVEQSDLNGNTINSIKDYGFNIGGPLVKDKIWFWGSYGVQDIGLSDMRGDLDDTLLKTYNAKFNFNLGNHRIELYAVNNDKIKEGRKRYPLDHYEASRKQTGPAYILKIQDEISIGNNALLSLKFSYTPTSYKLEPYGGRDKPVYEEYKAFRWNTGTWEEYDTDVYSASALLNVFKDNFLFGDHQFKLGVDYRYSDSKTNSQLGNGLQLTTVDGEGYYAKVWREWRLDYYTKRFSAFLQDTVNIGRFTVLLGLRYDKQNIGTRTAVIPGTNIAALNDVGGVNYNWQDTEQKGVDFPADFDFLSPRIGLIWDINGDGKTVLKGNFAIYGSTLDSGYLNTYQVDSYHDFDWYDNGNLVLDPGELDLYRTRDNYQALSSLDGEFFYDKNLKPEKDMEIVIGLEKEVLADLSLGLNFIYRKHYDINWTVPYVWDGEYRPVQASDWSRYSVELDGQTYYYWDTYDADVYDEGIGKVQLRPDYSRLYKGIEFLFKKRMSKKWMMNGSFIWQDTKINYDSRNAYIDPTDHEPNDFLNSTSGAHSYGTFVMNSRWMVKLNWLYQLPYGINFAGNFIAREGYIFPRVATLFDEYKRYWNNEKPVVLLDKYGESRYNTFYQLDLRVEKSFTLKNIGKILLSIDAFNITNNNSTLEKTNDFSLSNFNVPLVILNPRVFRLGFRFEF